MISRPILLLALLFFPAIGLSGSSSAQEPQRTYACQFATVAPTIDGSGDEPVWSTAATLNNFHMAWLGAEGVSRTSPTEAKILWDRDYIYFWAKLQDKDLKATVMERDGKTWEDDVFEVFLKPSTEHNGYYEFHVTPRNVQMDLFIPERAPNAFEKYRNAHEFEFSSAVKLNGTLDQRDDVDESWELEFRLSWQDFALTGGRPEPGETWTFSLCRYDFDARMSEPTLTSIAPLKKRSFHAYEDFLPIEFKSPAAPQEQKNQAFVDPPEVTSSRVLGNPEPPLPYTTTNRFPKLKIELPIAVRNEPRSDRVFLITQAEAYGPSKLSYFQRSTAEGSPQVLLEVANGVVHYDLAFHPKYPEIPHLFVGWNGPNGDVMYSRVTRYTVKQQANQAIALSDSTTVIEWPSNGHNGAALTFGLDGMLYVTSGDGTSDSDTNLRGQDLTELTAKVLRIDVSTLDETKAYSIPADNPFVDRAGARPETWAYGLRNPWRITTDRETGRIWVGQNGQDLWEQVYLVQRGANYGWSVMEGAAPFYINRPRGPDPIVPPIADHHHSEARSLTGGLVYHGSDPKLEELKGAYIYGDYSTGKVWSLWHDGNQLLRKRELADTPSAITAFEESPEGELWLLDHLGKSILQVIPNSAEDRSLSFPKKLSESGLFKDVQRHQLVDGAIPYSVNAPLWSDGAHKERWFVIPNQHDADRRIEFQNEMGWTFPNGTVLVKSFALDVPSGSQVQRRWIETRFMLREQNEWVGYSYRWNEDGTDAELVERDGLDVEFEVADDSLASGRRKQVWHYPSRAECMVCHSRAANYTLGLQTAQMNRSFNYAGVEENQLAFLERTGFFKVPPKNYSKREQNDTSQRAFAKDSTLLPVPPDQLPRLANPYDPKANLEERARAYLHSNCSSCHQPAGGGNATLDLRYQVALQQCGLIDEVPRHLNFDIPNAKIVLPGKPGESVLIRRVGTRENGKMPQLATSIVDQAALELLSAWIESLSSPKNEGGN